MDATDFIINTVECYCICSGILVTFMLLVKLFTRKKDE